ncbi:MAG: chromate efflux transporter [Terracidiphilus sp.]
MPDNSSTVTLQDGRPRGTFLEVLLVFLRLGCTSFGGPIAHLGYFQKEFVARRKWCGAGAMAEIIALAQSLPGPASSQVGFSLGILRAGWLGGLAAWIGFTLPSALLMLAFAYGHSLLGGSAGVGLLHGLQVVAVAVVAQAVLSMQRSLAPDWTRLALAFLAACAALILPAQVATLCAIALGAVLGLLLFGSIKSETSAPIEMRLPKAAGIASAVVFLALLIVVPLLARALAVAWLSVFSAFYRSGALVFGGGHVVLPLLESAVVAPGWVSQQSFLAGYGAAQALPGPLFAFSAYLGAAVRPSPSPPLYGLMSLLGLFAPGLLAVTAVLPFWSELRGSRIMQAALRGINASVVGILAAALIHPLWTSTIHTAGDLAIALVAFALLVLAKVQPWIVVVSVAIFTLLMTLV